LEERYVKGELRSGGIWSEEREEIWRGGLHGNGIYRHNMKEDMFWLYLFYNLKKE
jgi:hypothetical protein